MKYFLTGRTGFIGYHLFKKLIDDGHEVFTNMRNFHTEKYDAVIHLAAVTHTLTHFDPRLIQSNIILTNDVFKKNCKIIYASSCSAKHITNPYAYTKAWSEYCGSIHGNSIGLRFHNVYGNYNNKGIIHYLEKCPNGHKINVRGVDIVRDYVYVLDVIDFIVSILSEDSQQKTSRVIDVGTGVGTKTIDVVKTYMDISGKTFEIEESEAWSTEPKIMVSNNVLAGSLSLSDGIKKMIDTKTFKT